MVFEGGQSTKAHPERSTGGVGVAVGIGVSVEVGIAVSVGVLLGIGVWVANNSAGDEQAKMERINIAVTPYMDNFVVTFISALPKMLSGYYNPHKIEGCVNAIVDMTLSGIGFGVLAVRGVDGREPIVLLEQVKVAVKAGLGQI
jgi:hypothetical protein